MRDKCDTQLTNMIAVDGSFQEEKKANSKPTPEEMGMTKKEVYTMYAMFLLTGLATMAPWNVLLDASFLIGKTLTPAPALSQMLLTVNKGASAATAIFFSLTTGFTMNRWMARAIIFIGCVFFLTFPIPTYIYTTAEESTSAGCTALVILLVIPSGIALGGFQAQVFSFGGSVECLAEKATLIISLAQAMVGTIVWAIFTICNNVIWTDRSDQGQQQNILWVLVVVGLMLYLSGEAAFEAALSVPIFSRLIGGGGKKVQPKVRDDLEDTDVEDGAIIDKLKAKREEPIEPVKQLTVREKLSFDVLKRACYPALRPGILLASTLAVFPSVGPYGWGSPYAEFHLGVFQVTDVFVRLCVLSFDFLRFSELACDVCMYARIFILLPIYLLPALSIGETTPFLRSEYFLFPLSLLWVLSHALLFPSVCVACMTKPKNSQESDAFGCAMTMSIVALGWVGTLIAQAATAALH